MLPFGSLPVSPPWGCSENTMLFNLNDQKFSLPEGVFPFSPVHLCLLASMFSAGSESSLGWVWSQHFLNLVILAVVPFLTGLSNLGLSHVNVLCWNIQEGGSGELVSPRYMQELPPRPPIFPSPQSDSGRDCKINRCVGPSTAYRLCLETCHCLKSPWEGAGMEKTQRAGSEHWVTGTF